MRFGVDPTTRTAAWRDGDVVQLRSTISDHVLTGTVVVRGRMIKVAYTDVAKRDRVEWPDGWVIGCGALDRTCAHCDHTFATDDQNEAFCPPCLRDEVGRSSAGFRVNRNHVGGRWAVK